MAVDLLEWAFQRGFAPTAVLFDSAYLAENILHWLKAVDWHWVSRMKANRILKVDGRRFQPKDWAVKAEAGEVPAPTKSLVAGLRGWGEVRLIGVLPTKRSTEHRYLVGSNPHWTRVVVERLYKHRWSIETGFRTSNQLAGLKDCQARSWRAQENHVALVLLAYCFLETQRQRVESPGEALDRFRHRPLRADATVMSAKVRQLKHRRKPKPGEGRQISLSDLSA